ncbi:MAG: Ig-like domain-containing protein, partial [Silicimonas sp.]|nr:Ig-like domain-containing protein [Silicimonas sp.]
FGEGVFLLEDADGTEVAFTGAALIDALDNSDVSSALDEIKTMLTEGFSPIGGVNFFGNLPLDNVEIIDGFGDGDMDTKSGTHQIEVVQTTRLAGLSVDFDELAPEVASIAIDKITEGALEAAKSQPYLIPIVVGASIGAQAALELNQQTTKVLESGFASQLKVQPFDLVAAAVNPFIEGMNAVVGVLNTIMGAVPLVGSALQLPTIPLLTREGLETAFDATIDAMTDGLGFVINGMASVASDLLTAIANNPLVLGTADFLGDVAGFGLGAAGDALNKIADILGLLSGVGGIGGAVDSITGILNGAAGVVHAGANAARNFENAVQNMLTSAASLANETAANVEAGIDKVGSLIKDIARGVDMQLSTEFDFFSMVLDAGVDLVQIAKFDPDEVEVTYTLDGFTSDTHKVGDPAQFFASGNPGDVLDGKAVYSFAGDVDYDYRLKLDIVPNLTLYGIDVEGDIKIGENTSYDIDFDYAAVKTTQDFGIDDLAGLDPRDLFDDALLELPLGFVEEIMEVVADGIRSGLGEFAGQSTDLDFNELRLFELKDIALDRDQFSTITEDFQVEIGSNPPTPHIDLRFDENTDFATASNTLLQGFDGEMNKVKGSSLNFGKLFSMMGGNLFVTPTGAVVYADGADNNHLNVGDTKEDTFTYQVKNADGSLSWLAARVVIDGVNDAPVAIADTGTVAEDGSILLDVLANDTDVDDGASFTLVSGSSPDGTVTVEGNQLRVAPGADFTGAMVVTYTMADEHGAEAVGEAVITVTPVADDVRAVDDAVSISEEGAPLLIDVTANDIEVDGETITIEAITQPSKGTLEIVDGQNVRFDHAGAFDALLEGETEVVTATVTVTDGTGASQTQTLTITVEGANDAPTAVADLYTLDEDASGTFSVLDNDFDADVGGTFTLVGAQDGPNGSVTFDAATGQVTYTPDADFYGQDTFTYTLEDEQGAQSTGTVTVNVTPRGEILREGTATDDIFLIETPEDGRTVIFEGGDGVDVVRVAEQKQVVDLTDAEFVGIETLDLNYGAILLSGEKGHIDLSTVGQVINTRGIFGNSGTNTIFGSNASEVISGGLGADVLMGNGGNDVFLLGLGEAMGDIIDGGDGFDVVRANLMSTTLDIEGATFRNIERLDASGTYLQVDRNGLLDMSGVDYIHNTSGLHGSDGADTIRGSQSDDYIDSDEGADVLEGNDGDDIFGLSAGDHRGTVIDGGDGNDLIQLAAMEGVASLMGVSFTNVEG